MMRFLFIAPRYHTNQVEPVRTLLGAGHKVWFHSAIIGATENHRDVVPHVHKASIISHCIVAIRGPGVNNEWYCPAIFSYWKLFREISPQVVVIRWHNPLFCWLVGFYARLTGCHTVVYEQISSDVLCKAWSNGWIGALRRIHFRIRQRLLNAAWMTPLPGEATLPRGCYFVPFAVPVRAKQRDTTDLPRILEIGKFIPRKNHILFVEALMELTAEMPLLATIIGEASTPRQIALYEQVRSAVATAGLESLVTLRQNVDHNAMTKVYADHSVFVLPADAEPAAITPLEAMGQGLPVVVTDTCGTRHYVREGLDGFVCRSNSLPALAAAMRKAICLSNQPGVAEDVRCAAAARFSGVAFLSSFQRMLQRHFGMSLEPCAHAASHEQVRP